MVQLHAFEHGDIPRPTADIDLLGGAKRSPRMTETIKYESDRQDLIRLLTYVDDPRTLAADMRRKEPGWLRDAEPALGFGDPGLPVLLPIGVVQRAQQVLQLLARGSSYSESSTK
jgi:hypothetical protein